MRNVLLSVGALLAAAAPVAAAPAAPDAETRLARIVEGRTPGRPVNCINLRDIRSTEIVDGTAIVYRVGAGRTVYVNRPDAGVRQLGRDDIMVTRTIGSQLCSVDIVRFVDRTSRFPRGGVSLGKFVPYTRG